MARVLEEYDFEKGRRKKYPWNQWLDGQIWEIVRGEDYLVSPDQMRKNVYNAAWSRGLAVQTSRQKNKLIIQVLGSNRGTKRDDRNAA